ncbi:MAG: aminoglycoside phosphotransferase [Paenibacillus sp.]|nr:aminoglycoside phosphotransferase [Paenibacillus sp.]
MDGLIHGVKWIEKTEALDQLLTAEASYSASAMEQGFEAQVLKIGSPNRSFVLKVWNKSSKPDVGRQFRLLRVLSESGISVSKPYGWGMNENDDPVLLTSWDGMPVAKLTKTSVTELAVLLASIHRLGNRAMGQIDVPAHDFMGYFFAEAGEYDDLQIALRAIVPVAGMRSDNIIHGDYHLNNIVEEGSRLTVIDWTNGQWGDRRYDFAWSYVLKKIYVTRYAATFRSAYLSELPMDEEELDAFEALAILRWLFLKRRGGTPSRPDTAKRVHSLIAGNRYLRELKLEL